VRLETIACNQCGAPLSVAEAAQFVRCNHCAASLAVRRNESVTYTEVVEKLVEHTSKLAEQVAHLRYQNELERIDRDWQRERERHLIRHKDHAPTEPTRGAAIVGGLVAVVVGAIGAIIGGSAGAGAFVLFPLAFIVLGAVMAILGTKKAEEFERVKSRYLSRRGSLKVDDFLGDADEPITADDIPPLR
jgi:hypothetical protein